jgi:diacylglycerol kinase family enzyme
VDAGAPAALEQLGERLSSGRFERLLAIGGDGTAHLAVNALLAGGHGDRVDVGLVPAGTGSDFARTLKLPRSPEAAMARVLEASPRPSDAIEVDLETPGGNVRRYGLNVASAGLSGAAVAAVNAKEGRGSYLKETIKTLCRHRPRACRVVVDGELLIDAPFFLVAMANGRFFGKGMPVAPAARIDDGLLDVVLVRPMPGWQVPFRLHLLLTGGHVRLPNVTVKHAREVRFEPPAGFFPYEIDGETVPAVPATFRVAPGALRLMF